MKLDNGEFTVKMAADGEGSSAFTPQTQDVRRDFVPPSSKHASFRRQRLQSVIHRVDAERAELELVLSSRTFGRNNYVGRFLSFVCERYFEGSTADIKEYSIAVHALGRQPDFDPQSDTIVRVTAHNLRKRLELYYTAEGADHPIQICLPPGHYVPQFVHRGELGTRTHERYAAESLELESESSDILDASDSATIPSEASLDIARDPVTAQRPTDHRARNLVAALGLMLVAVLATVGYRFLAQRSQAESTQPTKTPVIQLANSGKDIHALIGADRAPFVDRAGTAWQSDHFCSGGSSFSVAGHTIQGTEDPQLFSAGRHGILHCKYPVPPGAYEVHLLFAETSGLQENSRYVDFSINGGPATSVDIVDDAGGDDIATTKIYANVQPDNDGVIHIDFATENSFVNAIEVLPSTPHHMLPVRIAAGSSTYRDTDGNTWLEDRYFFGGRVSSFAGTLSGVQDGRLYLWHRFGHFHYIIPVATGEKYTLKLHFLEHWFGAPNGGTGGIGSRVFDVSCNGSVLLKNFDIYSEAGSKPLVKTFPHIEPTAQGKIELYFTPAVNYPSISGIEIIPE